jgi:hypothetical protein
MDNGKLNHVYMKETSDFIKKLAETAIRFKGEKREKLRYFASIGY